MRGSWIWALLLIAAGVGGWLIFGGADAENDGDYGDSSVEDDGERAGPGLKGAAGGTKGVPRVPTDIRGRGMIQGVTRRGGEAVVATVELRHVQEIDPSNPFKGGAETQFIARLLDGGMSGKEVIARATTGEDGIFKFRGLAPGLYEIRATAEDGAMGFASASLPAAGARVEALVDIPEGDQVLKGRITYADGKAFRGTVLMAMGNAFAMMMGGTSKSMPAYTDEEGRFAIAGLSPGQYQVSALLPGVMRVMGAPIKVPFTGEYTLTINAAGKEVKGTVIDAETEEPVAGATIFGGGGNPESDFAIFTTKSDASGAFTMTLPVGRGGGMFVRADGYAGQTLDFNSSAPSDGLTVSLLRLAMLSGRVTAQEGGAAIAGITVFAMGGRGRGMMPTPRTAMTDADGRYTVEGVDPGAVKVWAVGAGQVSVGMSGTVMGNTNTPYSAELEPGETGELDLETVAAGKVAGRVLTESGQAVPGAVVQAASGSGGPGMMASLLGLGASWGSAVTDAEGGYAIDVLVPGGKYKITAKAPDHPTATSSEFVAVGGKTEAVDVRMKAPRWIDVTVVDAAGGKPVAGAGILAVPEDGNPAVMMEMLGGGAMWTTTADGTVRVGPLPEGKLKMQVKAPGFIDHDETEVEAGATAPVRVELQRGLVLAGRLELPEGVPFQSVRVNVNRSGPDGWFSSRPPVQADGTWRVDTIEHEGEYKVSANGRWQERTFAGETTAETGDEAVVVKLLENTKAEGEALTVTVVDQDGKPVPAGRVELTAFRGDNGTSSSRTRLNGGQAQFRGFNAEGEIYVEVYELIGSKRGATIQGPVTFQDGKLEVRLGAPLSIQGLVTDQDGKAVPGVKVTAQAVHPRGKNGRGGQEHGSSTTGTDGRFEVKALGELEYRLAFVAPPDYTPVESQSARAGASGIAVSLTMGQRAKVTVLDFDGKPVPGCYVWVARLDSDGNAINAGRNWDGSNQTGSDGTLILRGLLADELYNLTVHTPGGREDLKRIERKKWKPGDETLRFVRAYSITGSVVDQHGKPVVGARVQHRKVGSKDWTGWAQTDKKGAFKMDQLESGSYDLRASSGRMGMITSAQPGVEPAEQPGVVRARAGAKGVKLTVDLGQRLVVTLRGGKAGDQQRRTASLRPLEGGSVLQGTWKSSAKIEFQGLQEGKKYALWVGGLDDGRYAALESVDTSGGELGVETEAGGVIEGKLKLPAGVSVQGLHVSAGNRHGQTATARVDIAAGTFRLEGLPHDSTWSLSAIGWQQGGSQYRGSGSGTTGGTVTIELKKR